jgi:hypothetical protein
MTRTPHSLEEVDALVNAEQTEFTAAELAKFARLRITTRTAPCYREADRSDGNLFVVASDGKTAVVFDDVEQEFGICKAAALDSGAVREWGLAGSLVFALMHLK